MIAGLIRPRDERFRKVSPITGRSISKPVGPVFDLWIRSWRRIANAR